MKKLWIVLVALLVSVSAFADTLRLTDGTVVKGTIVSQDAQKVIIDSDLGRMEIPRYKVASMDFGNAPAAAPAATQAAPAATAPNIIINQNVSQNQSAGGGNASDGGLSEKDRKRAVLKMEQMVRSKEFLNKKKNKEMADQAALLPYEYRALLFDKHKAHGSFGYGLLNFILPSLGSFIQGDIGGGLTFWGLFIGGGALGLTHNQTLIIVGTTIQVGAYVWNLFMPGGYEKYYNKRLKEGLAVYYSSQLPSLDAPLFTSSESGIQVPVVSFEF